MYRTYEMAERWIPVSLVELWVFRCDYYCVDIPRDCLRDSVKGEMERAREL